MRRREFICLIGSAVAALPLDARAQRLGGELSSLSPDLILSVGSPGVKALQQATTTVPIIFIFVAEPVDQGFVQTVAHPGGNITSFDYLERTIGAKWLT